VTRLLALLLSSLALLVAACGTVGSDADEKPAGSGGWREVPQGPLSPREAAFGIWTGEEILLVGGSDSRPCPPTAGCVAPPEPLPDGAAFDPGTGTWRRLSETPGAFAWTQGVVLAETVYLWAPGTAEASDAAFMSYELEADRWRRLPLPPGDGAGYHGLVEAGNRLVAYAGSDEWAEQPDVVFDPAARRWSELPPDPLSPSFDRTMAWTGRELVLFDHELVPNPGSAEPSLTRAAAFDFEAGAWRVLPDSEILGSGPWVRSAGRLVNPMLGGADGGETNNWGRTYPYGGIYDPADRKWLPLPDPPSGETALTAGVITDRGAAYYAAEGWVLDTRTETWIELPPREEDVLLTGQTLVAAGEELFVFGGARWEQDGLEATLLDDASVWTAQPGR
jgi:hypothetical protein